MSAPVVGVGADQTGADVMLAMLDHDIRHVPVFSRARRAARRDRRHRPGRRGDAAPPSSFAGRSPRPGTRSELTRGGRPPPLDGGHPPPRRARPVPGQRGDLRGRRRADPPHDRARRSNRRAAPGRVLLDVARQPRQARADALLGRRLGHGLEGRARARPARSEPRRRLASTRTGDYMRGIAANVADCVRVIGWRLDPHGVTASGAFSASSIEDWRAGDRELAHAPERQPRPDRDLDPARRPGRLRARAGSTSSSCSSRPATAPTLERWMLRLALAAKPPTGFMHEHRRRGLGRAARGPSTSSTAGCCRSSTWRATRPCRPRSASTPTLERLRAAAERGRARRDGGAGPRGGLRAVQRAAPGASGRRSSSRAGSPTTTSTPRQLDPAHPPLPAGRVPGGRRRAEVADAASSPSASRCASRRSPAARAYLDAPLPAPAPRGARSTSP